MRKSALPGVPRALIKDYVLLCHVRMTASGIARKALTSSQEAKAGGSITLVWMIEMSGVVKRHKGALSDGLWFMHIIPALKTLRQEDCSRPE